jgi:hypothetical protein
MADNLDVNVGTGATIRMVEKSSKKAQVVVLDLGGAGAESLLTTTLPVSMATNTPILAAGTNEFGKLAAGEAHIGAIGGNSTLIDLIVTSASAVYSSGDMVGTELTIAGAARVNGGTGKITGVTVIDLAAQSVAAEIWITDTAITEPADNAAWSRSDGDAAKIITVIPLSAWYTSALNSVSPNGNLSIPFKCTGATTSLFMCYVNRGAPTHIVNGLLVRIFVDQD